MTDGPDTQPPTHPERIGPYQVTQILGEGGMAIVYAAEQKEPVRRRVAIKVMKVGMDTREVIGRFEAERQALAVMEHPGIAKVFDGAATDEGRPYFVMELVRGVQLGEFCDQKLLSLRERIELFVQVCDAVQHAHQKGVIHRDLKPANILVTEEGGLARAKVIDFGVAKATGHRLTERTVVTTYGQALGTLAYMSPEQAEMSGLDVDTRTDVYSLGVVLYELIVGKVPMDPREVGVPAFLAHLIQRDQSTPALSHSVGALDDERLKAWARQRGSDSTRLRRAIGGDLQWIVLKAVEKERDRRYDTARELAQDLLRYLNDEPVSARAPTSSYRLRKFVRRNRAAAVAVAVTVTALVSGSAVATAGMLEARRAQRVAKDEAETATQVVDFLVGLFSVNDPSEARGNSITAREILDRGADDIAGRLAGQPKVQARLMLTMGKVYNGLILPAPAEPLLRKAVAIRETEFGAESAEVAEALVQLALVLRRVGKNEDATTAQARAISIYEKRYGPDAPELLPALLVYVGTQGTDEFHERVARLARIARLHLDETDPQLAVALQAEGISFRSRNELDSAEARYRQAAAIFRAIDDPREAGLIGNLGSLASARGDYEEAARQHRRAIAASERLAGGDPPTEAATSYGNLSIALLKLGRNEEAEAAAREGVRLIEDAFGPVGHNLGWQLVRVLDAEYAQEDWDEVILIEDRLAEWLTASRPDSTWEVRAASSRLRIAQIQLLLGRHREALAARDLLQVFEGVDAGYAALSAYASAAAYAGLGRHAEAEPLFRRAIDGLRAIDASEVRTTQHHIMKPGRVPRTQVLAECLEELATMLAGIGRLDEAAQHRAEAERIRNSG